MAASKTRPGNPDRGWNDPPMFNYNTATDGTAPPRRSLNKRVAFPMTASGNTPGHAVLNPSQGPPILNPVLPADIQGPPPIPVQPPIPIGLRDTPLGNQAPPASPIHLLPPTADTSTPQTVPLLVPGLVPSSPPKTEHGVPDTMQLQDERLDELMSRLSVSDDSQLLQYNVDNLIEVLNKYKSILTTRVVDDIKKKLELFEDKWKSGTLKTRVVDDIKKKLELFEDKWKSGTLSEIVKVRITQLASALLNEETEKANHLHLALMVDHIAEVNQWMMGVKRLLHQQQLANKQKEIIAENKQNSESCDPISGDQGEITVNDSPEGTTDTSNQETVGTDAEISMKANCDNTEQGNKTDAAEDL